MLSKKISIGEGLDAIFSSAGSRDTSQSHTKTHLPISQLIEGRYQTRKIERNKSLEELADSIDQYGVLQAILVRPVSNGKYEVIAGHRRWHAAVIAGLKEVPVDIKSVEEKAVAAFTVIENIQRENLNPIEEAHAYQKLIDQFGLTHDEVAKRIGKPRTTVSNFLRLLKLPTAIQQWITEKLLDMGHAKVLLSLTREQQISAGQVIVQRGLSVRQTEAFIRELQHSPKVVSDSDPESFIRANQLSNDFSQLVGKRTKIKLKPNQSGKGVLNLPFGSLDELESIINRLRKL